VRLLAPLETSLKGRAHRRSSSFFSAFAVTAAQLRRSLLPPLSCLWLKPPHHRVHLALAHLLVRLHQPLSARIARTTVSFPISGDRAPPSRLTWPDISIASPRLLVAPLHSR
jgi:hypothetical protein